MSLNTEIIEMLKQEGCDIVGFAALHSLPEEARKHYTCGIIMGLPFTKEAMQENREDLPQRYSGEHGPMNQKFTSLKKTVTDFLTDKGYDATSDTPASSVDSGTLRALLPQKTVATLAGIGWIGKCAMLVTDAVGSALRLTVVLTNAPLDCGTPITKSKCSPGCNICVDICPGKAPQGALWEVGVDRDSFFNAQNCRTAARARAKSLLDIEAAMCGLCVSSCPFTKKGLGYK